MAVLIGGADNDQLTGSIDADFFDGGIGNDTMTGLGGNDFYLVDSIYDVTIETAKGGIDLVASSVDYVLNDNVENLTLIGTAIFGGGNALDNIITGNDQDNFLTSGGGSDTLIGGKGNDSYYVDGLDDKIVETLDVKSGGGDADTIISEISYSLVGQTNVEWLKLGGLTNINGSGNAADNFLFGNSGNNVLTGGGGYDVLVGNDGNDTLSGVGHTFMNGGLGDDTFIVDTTQDVLHEEKGEGTDTVISTVALAKSFDSIENYVFNIKTDLNFTAGGDDNAIQGGSGNDTIDGGGGDDHLLGMAGNDTLTGGAGNDKLDGAAGKDIMTGGTGDDVYYVDSIGDQVNENNIAGSNDLIVSSLSIDFLTANVESAMLTGKGALHLTGNDLGNTLSGNDGANVIDGGKGADTMNGYGGNDIYIVDDANDTAAEFVSGAKGGIDLVKSAVGFALGGNIENLILTGADSSYGTGNALDNKIVGNDGGNELDGGTGKDTLTGGKGDDYYYVDNSGDKVMEVAGGGARDVVSSTVSASLTKFANVEVLYLAGAADINATGSVRDDELGGNSGKNVLDGGKGADMMKGGDGDDTYYVENAGDKVSESSGAGTGIDTIISTIALSSGLANVENYTFNTAAAVHFTGDTGDNIIKGGSGFDILAGGGGHDSLYGNGGNDALTGGSLQDLLNGGTGADKMTGMDGNDIYIVDNVGDTVNETGGLTQGNDTVYASVSVNLLWDSVEDLHLEGTGALHATGNTADNFISGNNAANVLNGAGGDDQLYGLKGNDTLTGGAGSDTFYFNPSEIGNEGHDTITDFVKAEDVLSFTVGDVNKDNTIDLADLLASSSVVDHGIGKAVDVHFADGGMITFAGAGTGQIQFVTELVDAAATQIHVN